METKKLSSTLKVKILLVLAIAVTLSLGFYQYQEERIITLHLDQSVEKITSSASRVDEFLQEQNIELEEEGYINVSLDKKIDQNMDIIIRSPKTYTIILDGTEQEVSSRYSRVQEILTDAGIVLDDNDYAIPDLSSSVSRGHKISVFRVDEEVEVIEEVIPFGNVARKNAKLEIGTTKLIQEGQEGLKEVTVKTKFVNGQLIKKDILEEKIISEHVDRVVENGTKDRVSTSRGDTSFRDVMVMSATAYDLSFESCGKRPGDKYYGITASGTQARPGAVAVDPRVIPLGTKLYIESLDSTEDYGFATAEDTGGAIKGKKIDLFFHSARDVKNFGRRNVKVYILD